MSNVQILSFFKFKFRHYSISSSVKLVASSIQIWQFVNISVVFTFFFLLVCKNSLIRGIMSFLLSPGFPSAPALAQYPRFSKCLLNECMQTGVNKPPWLITPLNLGQRLLILWVPLSDFGKTRNLWSWYTPDSPKATQESSFWATWPTQAFFTKKQSCLVMVADLLPTW